MKPRTRKFHYLVSVPALIFAALTTRAYFAANTSDAEFLTTLLEPNKKYIRHSHFGIFTSTSYPPHWTIYYSEVKTDDQKKTFGIYDGIFGDWGVFSVETGPRIY